MGTEKKQRDWYRKEINTEIQLYKYRKEAKRTKKTANHHSYHNLGKSF